MYICMPYAMQILLSRQKCCWIADCRRPVGRPRTIRLKTFWWQPSFLEL